MNTMKKLSERVFYYPHQPETDRPMLAYLKGERIALAIDAGNSAAHVDGFYRALENQGLKKPDLTAITHWHWDHTFGMHHINGLSVAHHETGEYLRQEQERLADSAYSMFLKKDDPCLGREYADNGEISVVMPDIRFKEEMTLGLGGMTARIFHADSPHSGDTVLIHVPEEKILFLGDSTSEDFYNDGYMDYHKLRSLMHVIESTDCTYTVLSHTEPLLKQELLDYLSSLL